jgi:hypothetical protein
MREYAHAHHHHHPRRAGQQARPRPGAVRCGRRTSRCPRLDRGSPLLGIHLTFRFGTGHIQTIAAAQVIGVTVAASLLGWLLLALLERRTPHARLLWTTIAVAAVAASLALPLTVATTTSAVAGLIVMHVSVGAAVIPAMGRTARAR